MANDKNEEAMDLIRKAALMNGKPLQDDVEISQVKGGPFSQNCCVTTPNS